MGLSRPPDPPFGRMASAAVKPVWLSIVEKSVFRFDESESARKEAAPSVSFSVPKVREQEIDTTSFESNNPEFVPVFEKDGLNQVVTFKVGNIRSTHFTILPYNPSITTVMTDYITK